jgi:ankyrin repeat protein
MLLIVTVLLVAWMLQAHVATAFDNDTSVISGEYRGTINGTIHIVMTLGIWEDGVVTGDYFYQKNKIAIPLEGTFNTDKKFELVEKAPRIEKRKRSEEITGYFRGSFDHNFKVLEGRWSNYAGTKSFPFKLARMANNQAGEGTKNKQENAILDLPLAVAEKRRLLKEFNDNNSGSEEDGEYNETSIEYVSPTVVSMLSKSQYQGGAHPNHSYKTRNYRIKEAKAVELKLKDLFIEDSGFVKVLSDLCIVELKRQDAGDVTNGSKSVLSDEMSEFVITRRGLYFYFAPYVVGTYAEGDHVVDIPYKRITHLIKPDGPLAEFLHKGSMTKITEGDKNVQLIEAVETLDEALVAELLKRGANPNTKDSGGAPLLFSAVRHQDAGMMRLLLEHGAAVAVENDSDTPLLIVVRDNEVALAKLLLEKGAQINAVNSAGDYPLLVAMRADRREMIEFLLKSGAATTIKDSEGLTPLHQVCRSNNKILAEQLIRHGADINARDTNDDTPLMLVTTVDMARMLIAHGAKTDVVNKSGSSVLNKQIGRELTELYVSLGADVNHKTAYGGTPLQVTASCNDIETVRYLVSHGARVNENAGTDNTALMESARANGSRDVVAFLIEKGADVNARDGRGYTALMYAASNNNREVVNVLIKAGAKLNIRDTFTKETALTIARKSGFKEIEKQLKNHRGVE